MRRKFCISVLALLLTGMILSTSLSQPSRARADGTNLISNPSVETPDSAGTTPQGWVSSSWGSNTTTFSYLNTGEDGTRSVSVNMTSYTSGDAKWYFTPVTINPTSSYYFSDYYQSSVASSLVAWFVDTLGNSHYLTIGSLGANTSWSQAQFVFTTPTNAHTVTIFHLINAIGSLQTDNYVLKSAAATNLISNPSVETPDSTGTAPQGWMSSSWGSNTATFSYSNTGEDGTRSVSVNMTNYTSGDAKWYFTPVTVNPNRSYYFSDYYQSSTSTELVAWIVDTQGHSQYLTIGSLGTSAAWSQAQFVFTTPANAQTVTIFHLINSVGSLQTDNYVLRPQSTPDITDHVPNNSMEQVSDMNATQPLAWTPDSWGTNTAQFSYLNTGHTGSHSLEVQITSYSSGDAKWFYDPQATQSGISYRFIDYYESNITTEVYAMINKTDGTTQYLNLHYADPANTWTQYTDTFVTPLNTQSISILHVIAGVGYLITDDYTLTPYTPVGFNRALVSLTFDDALQSQYTNALPALNTYNMHATFYLISGFLNTTNYLTNSQALAIQQAGNEIGSHTVDHLALATLNSSQLTDELSQSQQTLQSLCGVPITDFASPEGVYNAQDIAAIQTYYTSHRSVDVGYNSKDNFNQYDIRTQSITSATTMSDIESWLAQAQQNKTWLVLVFHGVDTSGSQYSITPQNLNTVLSDISNDHLPVVTVAQGISELKPQV